MFKGLVLASMHNLIDERMEFLIRGRFSWLRFLGFRSRVSESGSEDDLAVPGDADTGEGLQGA